MSSSTSWVNKIWNKDGVREFREILEGLSVWPYIKFPLQAPAGDQSLSRQMGGGPWFHPWFVAFDVLGRKRPTCRCFWLVMVPTIQRDDRRMSQIQKSWVCCLWTTVPDLCSSGKSSAHFQCKIILLSLLLSCSLVLPYIQKMARAQRSPWWKDTADGSLIGTIFLQGLEHHKNLGVSDRTIILKEFILRK